MNNFYRLSAFQFPIAFVLFGYEAVKLYKEHKNRMATGNPESICGASIEWTALHLAFCALCGILGGTVGGLLGSGGGFILGPLLLEIGVIPQVYIAELCYFQLVSCFQLFITIIHHIAQVASATATFVMMFSSSLSVVEFYLLKRFPIPYGNSHKLSNSGFFCNLLLLGLKYKQTKCHTYSIFTLSRHMDTS